MKPLRWLMPLGLLVSLGLPACAMCPIPWYQTDQNDVIQVKGKLFDNAGNEAKVNCRFDQPWGAYGALTGGSSSPPARNFQGFPLAGNCPVLDWEVAHPIGPTGADVQIVPFPTWCPWPPEPDRRLKLEILDSGEYSTPGGKLLKFTVARGKEDVRPHPALAQGALAFRPGQPLTLLHPASDTGAYPVPLQICGVHTEAPQWLAPALTTYKVVLRAVFNKPVKQSSRVARKTLRLSLKALRSGRTAENIAGQIHFGGAPDTASEAVFVSEQKLSELLKPGAGEDIEYRVLIVGAKGAGVTDSGGAALDGNHDLVAGDDYTSVFRVVG